jgi:hypothetical protein
MKALFIEGRRNGYNPAQCGDTMTVAQLMAYLEQFDEDTPVFLKNDNGYTYGNIDDYSFEEYDDDEEGDED